MKKKKNRKAQPQKTNRENVNQKFPRKPNGDFSDASNNLASMLVMEGKSLIRPYG